MKNKASSHFMEALLLRTPATMFDAIWTVLKPRFAVLCVNPIANFVMQSFIAAAPARRFVADMVPLLHDTLADTLHHKRSGVACVLAVAAAAWRAASPEVVALITAALPDGVRTCRCLPIVACLPERGTTTWCTRLFSVRLLTCLSEVHAGGPRPGHARPRWHAHGRSRQVGGASATAAISQRLYHFTSTARHAAELVQARDRRPAGPATC